MSAVKPWVRRVPCKSGSHVLSACVSLFRAAEPVAICCRDYSNNFTDLAPKRRPQTSYSRYTEERRHALARKHETEGPAPLLSSNSRGTLNNMAQSLVRDQQKKNSAAGMVTPAKPLHTERQTVQSSPDR